MKRAGLAEIGTWRGIEQRERPGWFEVGTAVLVMVLVGFGGGIAVAKLGLSSTVTGLIFAALSGIAGFAGMVAALLVGRRPVSAYGICRTSARWLFVGVAGGIMAFIVKIIGIMIYTRLFGQTGNPQAIYAAGGSGGTLAFVVTTVFLAVLTPMGEEMLFRGVLTNSLLRYGAVAGVIGGSVIFAIFHGFNVVLPAALALGLFASELFRRSGSVWPGVTAHIVFNLPTIPLMILAT